MSDDLRRRLAEHQDLIDRLQGDGDPLSEAELRILLELGARYFWRKLKIPIPTTPTPFA